MGGTWKVINSTSMLLDYPIEILDIYADKHDGCFRISMFRIYTLSATFQAMCKVNHDTKVFSMLLRNKFTL
jgi:hypothetical protein